MMKVDADATEFVGPVLEDGETSRAVIEALRKTNAEVFVQDRGSYLRVLVARTCVLSRSLVEAELGRPFRLLGDLEQVMPSFKGILTVTRDEVRWSCAVGR